MVVSDIGYMHVNFLRMEANVKLKFGEVSYFSRQDFSSVNDSEFFRVGMFVTGESEFLDEGRVVEEGAGVDAMFKDLELAAIGM